ncbi:hypothetical protein Tco_0629194 [Tanacetum coccineum]|uniref:Uncharacterized protein n=1 Tax=Tanacetum coccineum TaxID=301880 RepID=A0ABQ4WSE2_9ASTR
MSFGSHSVGDPVIPKFDMYTYTSVLTLDEANSLAEEYAIPMDLRHRVPPSTLTMNKLPADKIVFVLIILISLRKILNIRVAEVVDQNRYPVITSLIHIESRKLPTAVLFDVDTGRISIVTVNTKEYYFDVLARSQRIMHRTLLTT